MRKTSAAGERWKYVLFLNRYFKHNNAATQTLNRKKNVYLIHLLDPEYKFTYFHLHALNHNYMTQMQVPKTAYISWFNIILCYIFHRLQKHAVCKTFDCCNHYFCVSHKKDWLFYLHWTTTAQQSDTVPELQSQRLLSTFDFRLPAQVEFNFSPVMLHIRH